MNRRRISRYLGSRRSSGRPALGYSTETWKRKLKGLTGVLTTLRVGCLRSMSA